jgi:endonuclease/exonuclease/phosphatase family metal-dependent hydrolase
MVRLATADDPDVVCLQEVPIWALKRLEEWSGMQAFGARAARPRAGSPSVGMFITRLHPGFFRSAFTGQANAILVSRRHAASNPHVKEVSARGEGETRVVQTVDVEGLGLVANFHVTSKYADVQLRRVVELVRGASPAVLCGDANLRPRAGTPYDELAALGYSEPLDGGIDQILVRGLEIAEGPRQGEHVVDGVVLSDHAPLEVRLR